MSQTTEIEKLRASKQYQTLREAGKTDSEAVAEIAGVAVGSALPPAPKKRAAKKTTKR